MSRVLQRTPKPDPSSNSDVVGVGFRNQKSVFSHKKHRLPAEIPIRQEHFKTNT